MSYKYLIFADLYVSIVNFSNDPPQFIFEQLFNVGKSFQSEMNFDELLNAFKNEEDSILSHEEMEKKIKEVIDFAVLQIANVKEYNSVSCILSANIYYRLISASEPLRFDKLNETKRLNTYFHQKLFALDKNMGLN